MSKDLNSKLDFKAGDFITGKDRSFPRSIYLCEGFIGETIEARLISYLGNVWDKDRFVFNLTSDKYRLATPQEIKESFKE